MFTQGPDGEKNKECAADILSALHHVFDQRARRAAGMRWPMSWLSGSAQDARLFSGYARDLAAALDKLHRRDPTLQLELRMIRTCFNAHSLLLGRMSGQPLLPRAELAEKSRLLGESRDQVARVLQILFPSSAPG